MPTALREAIKLDKEHQFGEALLVCLKYLDPSNTDVGSDLYRGRVLKRTFRLYSKLGLPDVSLRMATLFGNMNDRWWVGEMSSLISKQSGPDEARAFLVHCGVAKWSALVEVCANCLDSRKRDDYPRCLQLLDEECDERDVVESLFLELELHILFGQYSTAIDRIDAALTEIALPAAPQADLQIFRMACHSLVHRGSWSFTECAVPALPTFDHRFTSEDVYELIRAALLHTSSVSAASTKVSAGTGSR